MDETTRHNIRARTDAKLRYAQVHFDELIDAGRSGSDFERAHLESTLFHLLGARDAFLLELSEYYSLGPLARISVGSVRDALKSQNKSIKEVAELYSLEKDDAGWFFQAKRWRDHTMHKGPLRHHFTLHAGTVQTTAGDIDLEDPKTGERIRRGQLSKWLENMRALLERLRQSALLETQKDYGGTGGSSAQSLEGKNYVGKRSDQNS